MVGVDTTMELTTPTGAALLSALATERGPMPPVLVAASGYGAGGRDIPGRPNVTRVIIGELSHSSSSETVVSLETNVDDVTGETLAHTIDELLTAGALDAWTTAIVMKKGRPAHTVHVLTTGDRVDALIEVLGRETGTLGIRVSEHQRRVYPRETVTVDVDGHVVAVKVGPHRAKAEHDDVVRAARALDRPLRHVAEQAEGLAHEQQTIRSQP
jgi:uncharacterized protein (DUF111 family)